MSSNLNAAIIGLVRGHSDPRHYACLVRRNRLIKRNVLPHNDYDVIIFHEGDVLLEHQEMISCGISKVEFVDVGGEFRRENQSSGVGQRRLGYKNMCRFYGVSIFDYLRDYDYVMRLDDDSFIESKLRYDIFDFLKRTDCDHGYVHAEYDTHIATLATLPEFTRNYAADNGLIEDNREIELDGLHYYSNFAVMRLEFWRRPEVIAYLDAVDHSDGIYAHRWGDHVIHAHALKLFSHPTRLRHFSDFKYTHYTHHWSNYQRGRLVFRVLRAIDLISERNWMSRFVNVHR